MRRLKFQLILILVFETTFTLGTEKKTSFSCLGPFAKVAEAILRLPSLITQKSSPPRKKEFLAPMKLPPLSESEMNSQKQWMLKILKNGDRGQVNSIIARLAILSANQADKCALWEFFQSELTKVNPVFQAEKFELTDGSISYLGDRAQVFIVDPYGGVYLETIPDFKKQVLGRNTPIGELLKNLRKQ